MARTDRQARRKPRQAASGVLRMNRRGVGFVSTAEGEYRIASSRLNGAMDGDTVEVRRLRGRPEPRRRGGEQPGAGRELPGVVSHVLARSHLTVIGELHEADGLRVVVPLTERVPYDILIDIRAISAPADPGDIVEVRLTTYPSRLAAASGYILEVLGRPGQPGLDMEVILRRHGVPTAFPAAALAEAAALARDAGQPAPEGGAIIPSGAGRPDAGLPRRDLTGLVTFTIDPPDARDFDDALSIEPDGDGLLLSVHIADVAAFVPLGSALELSARDRSTSVYLPGRLVPMLPEELTQDICSLRPGVERLCLSVLMRINPDGGVADVQLTPSRISSSARLSYEQVDACLQAPPGAAGEEALEPGLAERLAVLASLAGRLRQRRLARGALEFESSEAKVLTDADGVPTSVTLRRPSLATSLVEEAMILANEQVAAYLTESGGGCLYRVHEPPQPEALEEAISRLGRLGYLPPGLPPAGSACLQAILEGAAERPEAGYVSYCLLRAMRQARYSERPSGHFGLASEAYCHFTSPIRRYPDLLVHHLLRLSLAGAAPPAELTGRLAELAELASRRERAAEAATREAVRLKTVEHLAGRLGDAFQAEVVEVGRLGIFVRELSTGAEGLVRSDGLPLGWEFEPEYCRYHDQQGGLVLKPGSPVRLRLAAADLRRVELDFVIV